MSTHRIGTRVQAREVARRWLSLSPPSTRSGLAPCADWASSAVSLRFAQRPRFSLRLFDAICPDGAGRPLFLIGTVAVHTQNLQQDARASLLVATEVEGDPLRAARVTVVGQCSYAGRPEDRMFGALPRASSRS